MRACRIFRTARSTLHYEAKRPSREAALVVWMRTVVREQPDWGYRLVWGHARNQGWHVSLNRVHRLWQKHALQQPQRVPRRKVITGAKLTPAPLMRNHIWCYDFVHDRDAAGRVIRCLTVKDEASAYALAVVPARAYNAADVRAVLERLVREYGYPAYLRSDQGSEFIAADLREWLAANRIQPAYIDAGKPWQNGSSESFNGTLRRGCLNRYEFHGIEDAAIRMEQWRRIYNEVRPHSRLGYLPPTSAYFLERFQEQPQVA
ncbi:MAG: IS3 family transposase [Gammaproteobacteria bacterium]|nr:IS3 family transposase [Gammaproteobacteria bacterium]